jgi:hypothetical protein
METWDTVSKKPLVYPGVNLFILVDRLKKKLQKILLANSLPLQMYGIGKDEYTAKARHADPKTAIAVLQNVYEPKRLSVFAECRRLNKELHNFTELLKHRAFMIEEDELDVLFNKYFEIDYQVNNLNPKVYEQEVITPFRMPNPKDILCLRHNFVPVIRNDYDKKKKKT